MFSLCPPLKQKFFYPGTGNPVVGGYVYTILPGTTAPLFGGLVPSPMPTYVDSLGAATNTNPIILDGNGEASVWLSGYTKMVVYDPNGVLLYTMDNVSSSPAAISTSGNTAQFNLVAGTPTYLSTTQFSMVGALTGTFIPGVIVRATLAGVGDIYGVVSAATVSGTSPQITTVTVSWYSTVLAPTVNAIAVGILSPPGDGSSFPIYPLASITTNYTFTVADLFKVFNVYSPLGVALTLTLPTPTAIPSGAWIEIKNTSVGTATLAGLIEGITGLTLQCGQSVILTWTGGAGGPIAIWGDDATGTLRMHATGVVPAGWLVANGNTIGDAASGAGGLASDGTYNLFWLLWTYYSDAYLPIYTSAGGASARGASAVVDFAAHKRMSLPNLGGHVPVGAGNASGGSLFALGETGGAETHTQDVSEVAPHTHTYNTVGGAGNLSIGINFDPAGASANTGTLPAAAAMSIMNPFFGVYFIIKL